MEEWELLNERQQSQAEDLAENALEYGKFDQTAGANGSHYAPASANPFKASGMICKNCVFYDEAGRGCQIVTGEIEPEAICKLWIIPETMIVEATNNSRSVLELKKKKLNLIMDRK
jgi:hypothetical protein